MAVLIPNCVLGVARVETQGYNDHGEPIAGLPADPPAALPGKRTESADGAWQLALDPSLWPVRVGDLVVSADGQAWLVQSCQLIRTPEIDEFPPDLAAELDVSFIRVTGAERQGAYTEPGGAGFVGR